MRITTIRHLWAAILLPILVAGQSAGAAIAIFLEIPGIPGESTAIKHLNEIDVHSFGLGVSGQTMKLSTLTAGGTSQLSPVTIEKYVDASTPKLFLAAAIGQILPKAVLVVETVGKTEFSFFTVTLTDVTVGSVTPGGEAGNVRPVELITLNFSRIEIEYVPQKPDGQPGTPIKVGYDIKKNTSF